MKKLSIVVAAVCLTLSLGAVHAGGKHKPGPKRGPERPIVVKGGDVQQKQRVETNVRTEFVNEIPVTVTNDGSLENTSINDNQSSATSSSDSNIEIGVEAPNHLSLQQTYKHKPAPGVVTTQAIAPEVQLYELSTPPAAAALTGVSRYNYECRPVDTSERPLTSREDESFHGKFYTSFSPHQDYLAMAERIPARVKAAEVYFPPERVRCLGLLFIESNGKGKVSPDQFFNAARNYVTENLLGPSKAYLVPLENSIAANRGVTSTSRGFSATGGGTRIFDSLLQATVGIGGAYGSGNAFTEVRIGGTFLLVAPAADGKILDFGYMEKRKVPAVGTSQKTPVKPVEIAKKERSKNSVRGTFAGDRRKGSE